MDWTLACQAFIAFRLVLELFAKFYIDVEVTKQREPRGFGGIVTTVIAMLLVTAAYWKAGAFTELLP